MESAHNDGKALLVPKRHTIENRRAGRERPRAMAGYRQQDEDAFIDEDIAPPNLKSQYRGFQFILLFVLGAAILAVVFGLMESAKDVLGAFTSFSSLLERAAWAKLLAGLGTLTTAGLLVVLAALVWRWRKRRSASRRRRRAVT